MKNDRVPSNICDALHYHGYILARTASCFGYNRGSPKESIVYFIVLPGQKSELIINPSGRPYDNIKHLFSKTVHINNSLSKWLE